MKNSKNSKVFTGIFAREGDPSTCAIVAIMGRFLTANKAFEAFHRICDRWLKESDEGKELNEDSCDDFNIGDFMINEVTILKNEEFRDLMKEEGIDEIVISQAEFHATYDRLLGHFENYRYADC